MKNLRKLMYFVYILKCKDNSLYTGITTDINRRFLEHKNGRGGNYTRSHKATKIIYSEKYPNRSKASRREYEIKSLKNKGLHLLFRICPIVLKSCHGQKFGGN